MADAAEGHERTVRTLEPYPAAAEAVGAWLGAMQEVRSGLLNTMGRIERARFGQDFLDWRGPDGDDNSVGTLLYHIASVEAGWLYFDIQLGRLPDDFKELFPVDDWDGHGRLTHVPGRTIGQHLELLAEVRSRFLQQISPMTLADWRTVRAPEGDPDSATPEWIVFHLVEHEAGHLYEIRRAVRKWLASS